MRIAHGRPSLIAHGDYFVDRSSRANLTLPPILQPVLRSLAARQHSVCTISYDLVGHILLEVPAMQSPSLSTLDTLLYSKCNRARTVFETQLWLRSLAAARSTTAVHIASCMTFQYPLSFASRPSRTCEVFAEQMKRMLSLTPPCVWSAAQPRKERNTIGPCLCIIMSNFFMFTLDHWRSQNT